LQARLAGQLRLKDVATSVSPCLELMMAHRAGRPISTVEQRSNLKARLTI